MKLTALLFTIAGLIAFLAIPRDPDAATLKAQIAQGKKEIAAYRASRDLNDDLWRIEAAKEESK